ncbi:MAG: TonB-dependent receptor [Pseudomonadota bacterium]
MLCSLLCYEQAYAQDTPTQLAPVIVTAEKLGRQLNETATSVTVFSGADIEDQGDQSLSDLMRRTANASAAEEGNFSIRGISQSGAGGGVGAPLISVQVDGVTLDNTAQQGALDDMFDVGYVEVLRGAQSTSQGRNALAGAVTIHTQDPTREWDTRLRLQAGQRGTRGVAAAGGGPLGDSFAFRLLGNYQKDDGFITHLPDKDKNFAQKKQTTLRGKLSFTPTALPSFTSLLTLGGDDSKGQPDYNIESGEAGSDPAQRRTSTVSVDTSDHVRSRIASWRNALDLGEDYTINAITAYMRTKQEYLRDYDGIAEEGGRNDIYNNGRNLTQELRLNIKELGPVTGVVGVYGGRFKDHNLTYSYDVRQSAASVLPVPLPVVGDLVAVELDFTNETDKDARNLAAFSEFDVKLPWRLTATFGLRYDTETLDVRSRFSTERGDAFITTPAGLQTVPLVGVTASQLLGVIPGINVLPLLAAGGIAPDTAGFQGGKTHYSALLPKLGLRHAINQDWSVFATYSEAYRAGGIDIDTTTGEALPFDPEYTKNYELAVRGKFHDLPIEIAANVFYTDWEKQQVPVLRGYFFVTQNAGRSRLYGGETSVTWKPTRGLRVDASVGLVQTKFLEYRDGDEDYAGNQFVFAPRATANIGATWRSRTGLMAAVNLACRSSSFASPENAADERSESRQLLDARVGWESNYLSLYVSGRNLLNQDYVTETYQFREGYVGAPTPRGYASYGALRWFGVQAEARF